MTAIVPYEWAPRPAGFIVDRKSCNCGICVIGAGWMITHCARCGAPLGPLDEYGWQALCARCWNE